MALNVTAPLYHNRSKPNGPCPSTKFTMIFFVFVCVYYEWPFINKILHEQTWMKANTVYTKHVTKQTIIMINSSLYVLSHNFQYIRE